MPRGRVVLLIALFSLSASGALPVAAADPVTWYREFEGGDTDYALQVGADGAGNIYAVGQTQYTSVWMISVDPAGDQRWFRSWGDSNHSVTGLAVDAAGRSFAVGYDLFPLLATARVYEADGVLAWEHNFGPEPTAATSAETAADGGFYVAGNTSGTFPGETSAGQQDAFLRKYDANGTELWTRQFGTEDTDIAKSMAATGDGGVLVGGETGNFTAFPSGSAAYFLTKFDGLGNREWTTTVPLESIASSLEDVAVDSLGDVYAAGQTTLPGQTYEGQRDAFVRKYSDSGDLLWTRQFGTEGFDSAEYLAVGSADEVYVGGRVQGLLAGPAPTSVNDSFVRAYDPDGSELWTRQYGNVSYHMTVGPDGDLIFVGRGPGSEPAFDEADPFIMRGVPPALPALPTPSTVYELDTSLNVSWPAESDAGSQVGGYHVDVHGAAYRGSWWDYNRWKDVDETVTSGSYPAIPGGTYCFRARSLDAGGGLTSAWTPNELCRAVPLDDVQLTASPSWKRFERSDYYLGTYSQSSSKGATLRKYDVVAKRIGLVATRCPGCGTVDVLWNGTLLRRIELNHSTVARQALFFVKLFGSARAGDITIKIVSSGKPVFIDGLGLSRAAGP